MLQCVAVWCSKLQCVAVCCSVVQCVAVCCSVCVQCVGKGRATLEGLAVQRVAACCSVLQFVPLRSRDDVRVLQCVAVWCSMLQCGAVCCSVLHYDLKMTCIETCMLLRTFLSVSSTMKLLYGIATDLTNENSDSCGMIWR